MPINLISQEERDKDSSKVFLSPLFALALVAGGFIFIMIVIGGLFVHINNNSNKAVEDLKKYEEEVKKLANFENRIVTANTKAIKAISSLGGHVRMDKLLGEIDKVTEILKKDIVVNNILINSTEKSIIINGYATTTDINIPRSYAHYLEIHPNKNNTPLAQKKEVIFSEVKIKEFKIDTATNTVEFTITAKYSEKVYGNE